MQIYRFYVLSASSDPENYRYVGVTSKKSVEQRFYGHKYCAMHEEKRVLPVHKWMYKHYEKGETILVKEIHSCDESVWENEEQRLIKEYKDAGYDLLNVQKGGAGVVTKEMRDADGITRSLVAHEKAIYAIDPKTMEIKYEFDSTIKAAKALKIKARTAIGNVLSGRTKTCNGYYWVYKEDWNNGINKINTAPDKDKSLYKLYKFDFNGNFIKKYESLEEFMKFENIANPSAVKKAAKEHCFYLGSFWSFTENLDYNKCISKFYTIKEVDSNGNIIKLYQNQAKIANVYGLSATKVCTLIKNHMPLKNGNYLEKINNKN